MLPYKAEVEWDNAFKIKYIVAVIHSAAVEGKYFSIENNETIPTELIETF